MCKSDEISSGNSHDEFAKPCLQAGDNHDTRRRLVMKRSLLTICLLAVAIAVVILFRAHQIAERPSEQQVVAALRSDNVTFFRKHARVLQPYIHMKVPKTLDTLLHMNAKVGGPEVAKWMIHQGCNVNSKNIDGNTPLHYAAYYGNSRVTQILLDNGAQINAINNKGQTPLSITAESLWGKPIDQVTILRSLLNHGGNAKTIDSRGWTPLHNVIDTMKGTAAVSLLIGHGADCEARTTDDMNYSVLDVAVLSEDKETVKLLLDHGVKVNAKNIQGDTSLVKAIYRNNEQIVDILLTYGANVNTTNVKGDTPLSLAKKWNHPTITHILEKHNARR